MKYTKEDFDAYKNELDKFNKVEGKLNARVEEIIRVIYLAFGSELRNWYYPNSEDEDIGFIWKHIIGGLIDNGEDTDEEISYVGIVDNAEDLERRHSVNDDVLGSRFPAKWIFWEDELIKKWILDEKEKREKRWDEERALKQKVLNKLTKEERAILGYGSY